MVRNSWAKCVFGGLSALGVVLAAVGAQAAPIGPWLDDHPKVAYSVKWQFERDNGPGYYELETSKISYPNWSAEQKQALEDAFAESEAWFHSADPLNVLNETIEYPPTNISPEITDDNAPPYVEVTADYAWDMYIRWVAQSLMLEVEGALPYSLLDYNTHELRVMLDSTAMFGRINANDYEMATGAPTHSNYIRMEGNKGESVLGPPRYTYAWLKKANLIGTDRKDTIVRLLDWSKDLWHFEGLDDNYHAGDVYWQYRGAPPVTRIIEGTTRQFFDFAFGHFTEGCHGTTGFWRNVLRGANIPMYILNRCDHSLAYFPSEGVYIDHGDDVYNTGFHALGVSSSELFLDEAQFFQEFGDNPDNNTDYCLTSGGGDGGMVGHQVDVLMGTADICGDGLDNDNDGLIDCEDTDDCPSRTFTEPTKLVASDEAFGNWYGYGVAYDQGRLLVTGEAGGADDDVPHRPVGAAYFYHYSAGSGWVQDQRIVPSNPNGYFYHFGNLALQGDTALIGKYIIDPVSPPGSAGTVVAFNRQTSGQWLEQQVLAPTEPIDDEGFGQCVTFDGDTAVVGAWGNVGVIPPTNGAVYVFQRTGGTWTQSQHIWSSSGVQDLFGTSCQLAGDLLVVGAEDGLDPTMDPSVRPGAIHVLRRNTSGQFVQEARLQPTVPGNFTLKGLGYKVSVSGNRILASAFATDINGVFQVGAVFLYEYDGSTWSLANTFIPPDTTKQQNFGAGVDIHGDKVLIGAQAANDGIGAVYEYQKNGSNWDLTTTRVPKDGIVQTSAFGSPVVRADDFVFATAIGDPEQGPRSGAVYVYDTGSSNAGQCVTVSALVIGNPNVNLTFSQVKTAGTTGVTTSSIGPVLPPGLETGMPATYYDVHTTADTSGPIHACISYGDTTYAHPSTLTLLHYESASWVDVCASERGCTNDTTSKVICGYVDSLSPFVVVERQSPHAVFAGASAECTGPAGANVTLDGSVSSDPSGTALGYAWSAPGVTFTGGTTAHPSAQFPLGSTTVTLTVTNGFGLTDTKTATVVVGDTTRPNVTFVPADINTTTCTGVNLGNATGSDLCGGTVTVTKNAPAKFSPGVTTITWTLTDQRGNKATATQKVLFTLGDDATCCPAGTNIIQGTPNNDTLTGTSGADCILGKGGQDTINGNDGNDYISGGDGDDIINGGNGNDIVFGGTGQDTLSGGNGNDVIYGGDGDDSVFAGANDDTVYGGQGQDTLRGEDGNDKLFGEVGDDTLQGGNGNDTMAGGPGTADRCTDTVGVNASELCEFGAPNACANGALDGSETGVDCGGGACAVCSSSGAGCQSGADCASGLFCIGLTCQAH